ncbi:9211_t:CDS:10, partial [Funneliformis caledonium]
MTPRRSSELDISPPSPFRTPTPPEQSPTGGGQSKRKKSREEKDSIFSFIFGSNSRPSSPSYDPSLQSMNNLAARSSKRGGLVRKLSAGNVKSALTLPSEDDEPRRKSFDSVQPDMNTRYGYFPPEEIAPFAYQASPMETRKGSSTNNPDAHYYRHRRTKSSDSDSAVDSGSILIHKEKEKKTIFPKWFRKNSKDKESSPPEVIHRKNSDAESYIHPNLIITPTMEREDPFTPTTPNFNKSSLSGKSEKSDHLPWRVGLKKEKSGRKKEATPSDIILDIDDMDGIIRTENREHRLSSVSTTIISYEEMLQESESSDWIHLPSASNTEMWSPPESWAVRKPQPNDQQFFPEDDSLVDDNNNEPLDSSKKLYCIRIFRPDATFGTVSCYLSTTTAELCHMLGKKFFIQDISKYNLYVKRHNLERMLSSKERPLKLQKQWLEQEGYTEHDNLEDLGREDNSYLVRFTFRETTVPRFEEEQGAFSSIQHVDLQARNLQTIPIFLYRQAYFIRSLNVSQNLMLDLPTDFIQSCHQLKELHLSQNELERVPQSVRQSQMLSSLNLSSNRLRDLEHAQLDSLTELTNFQVDNNVLTSLPESFVNFHHLNILNVSNNSFIEFPPAICNIISLSELDISFNNIKSVPLEIGKLINLKRLFLIGNQIMGTLPSSFNELICLRELDIRHNQFSNIDVLSLVPNLEVLLAESNNVSIVDLSSSSLQQLILSNNRLTQFSLMGTKSSITDLSLAYSKLTALSDGLFEHLESLEKLDISNNQLTSMPKSIGLLKRLTNFSCTNNTLSALPSEISSLTALRVLDIHNNNLSSLPPEIWFCASLVTLNASSNLLEQFPMPPPLSLPSSIDVNQPSSVPSNLARSNLSLSYSLRALYLGDNRLTTEVFSAISLFTELRILNLSFNSLDEFPTGITILHLTELYLSGNSLSSLPDDIERLTNLKILHINGNKLQTLPAELSKIRRLVVLDVGSNALKYNIANWQYEWNWNWNIELKYLNLSGNKRFEIKPAHLNEINPLRDRNLADFGALTRLRVLGLMDITLLHLTVPDETDNRRVRTSSSEVNSMAYGMADTLGTSDNLSTWEAVIPKFRGRKDECLFGLFEGHAGTNRGGRVNKYLHDWFQFHFKNELEKLKDNDIVESALRRSFLSLNKELGLKVFNSNIPMEFEYAWESESTNPVALGIDDNKAGASGIVVYISGKLLYVAHVGDIKAIIGRNDGNAQEIARGQSTIFPGEVVRIREAGGFISHNCLVNGEVDVSRSFGHFHLTPIINANPYVEKIQLSEQDELIILATRGLWDHMSYQTAVDVARTEDDLMRAAQKLRDFAISYGAEENIMVMIIRVGDLFNRRFRRGPEGLVGDEASTKQKRGRKEKIPNDSMMARLQEEIDPPIGKLALVFTDIKNSTFLWETIPIAMRHAIKQHNTIMRRQLRNIGGYEVKTEGDAFMVSFPTVASALLWCFTVQVQLLQVDWPSEIIESEDGKVVYSKNHKDLIYKGLSVRMGIHWGSPVCETDIVTKRMDYFGPMVNRAARICNAADGGQICVSSDVEAEIRRLDFLMDGGGDDSVFRKNSTDEDMQGIPSQPTNGILGKNLIHLRKIGFVLRKIGEKKLKGLENPEELSLVYPSALKGRMEEDQAKVRFSKIYEPPATQILNPAIIKALGYLCLRLERLSSGNAIIRNTRASRLDYLSGLTFHVKEENASDEELLKIMESLITRIENSISTLYLTNVGKFALGDVITMDSEYIVKALQMYAQYM